MLYSNKNGSRYNVLIVLFVIVLAFMLMGCDEPTDSHGWDPLAVTQGAAQKAADTYINSEDASRNLYDAIDEFINGDW